MLSNEIERLNNVIKIKLSEIEDWRQKCSNLEIQVTKIKQYDSKIGEYEQRISNKTFCGCPPPTQLISLTSHSSISSCCCHFLRLSRSRKLITR